MFMLNGNYKWIDLLPRLVLNYNARKHRMIGMRPVDVTPAVAERLLAIVYSAIKIAGPAKFKVGDLIHMSKYKMVFEKGYTSNWTTKVFKIVKVQRTNSVTYLLEDYRGKSIAGAFYEYGLHRAIHPDIYLVEKVLHRRGNEVYVKWLGFDGSQFMDTQCVVKIKIYYKVITNLLSIYYIIFFHTKIEPLLYKHIIRI